MKIVILTDEINRRYDESVIVYIIITQKFYIHFNLISVIRKKASICMVNVLPNKKLPSSLERAIEIKVIKQVSDGEQ